MFILKVFSRLIQLALKLDPQADDLLLPLIGQCIALDLQPALTKVYVLFTATDVMLLPEYNGKVHLTIAATPGALLALAYQTDSSVFSQYHIGLDGEISLLTELQRLVQRLNLDWMGLLEKYVGEMPVSLVGACTKKHPHPHPSPLPQAGEGITRVLQQQIECLVQKDLVNKFIDEVGKLRDDVDRLAAKLQIHEATLE